jgi:transglutaminase-like putative cysteine protease
MAESMTDSEATRATSGATAAPAGAAEPSGLDWRQVDWPRVARAEYLVRQQYRYAYTAPVADLAQRLMMIPPDRLGDQRLIEHHLVVRGAADEPYVLWKEDVFGNRVARVRAGRVPVAIEFDACYRVERSRPRPAPRSGGAPTRPWDGGGAEFLEPTALTAPDARLRAAAARLAEDAAAEGAADQLALAERAHEWAAGAIAYQFGITGVQTPAAMALHLGKGVCQDYAHILLCVLRLLGVPARYVSGHLLGEGAPHAWVEALVVDPSAREGFAVVAYDPTNRRRAGLQYVNVAVGRDYADIRPTSGVFTGPATGKLTATKHAEVVRVAYRAGGAGERDGGAWPRRAEPAA